MKTERERLDDILRDLYTEGNRIIRAATVAERMWPESRRKNARGQVFHLGAGVAGSMLRAHKATHEIRPREWLIVPEYLGIRP